MLDNYEEDDFVLKGLHETHFELYKLKKVMGKGEEAVLHAKKVLEIREKVGKKGCIEIGLANYYVCDAYSEVGNFKEALPFALKALEIYKKHLANDSREFTMLRMSLGVIYAELGEYDMAFEQNQLSLSGFKRMGDNFCLLMAQLAGGHMLVDSGRYEEAIEAVKAVISQAETAGNQRIRAEAFIVMAKAFCGLEKFADARKYIKFAVRILEKKGLDLGTIATGFMEMAKLYEEMKEYEAAISLVQKALNIPELGQDYFADCSLRLFSLVSLTGTEKKRLSVLEEVVERLKEKSGQEHCHVCYAYKNLGDVYLYLGRPEMAAGCFVRAKDILDVSLGPHHPVSLTANLSLSIAYAGMKSYDLAIENQERVVEGFKGLEPSEQQLNVPVLMYYVNSLI